MVGTYDPAGMSISVGGSTPHGLADATFLTIEYENELFTVIQGADGEVARVKNPGALGTINLGLLQTSTFNAVLSALAAVDQLAGTGIVPFVLREGNTVLAAGECWIERYPTVEYAKEPTAREWLFRVAKFTAFVVGGN